MLDDCLAIESPLSYAYNTTINTKCKDGMREGRILQKEAVASMLIIDTTAPSSILTIPFFLRPYSTIPANPTPDISHNASCRKWFPSSPVRGDSFLSSSGPIVVPVGGISTVFFWYPQILHSSCLCFGRFFCSDFYNINMMTRRRSQALYRLPPSPCCGKRRLHASGVWNWRRKNNIKSPENLDFLPSSE